MYSYCLFCLQQKIPAIVRELNWLSTVRVLSPQLVQRKWVRGVAHEETHPYLPGYLFMYSEEELESFRFARLDGVIRVLGDLENRFQLGGGDRAFAEMLLSCDGVIGAPKVYELGDRIERCEGAMQGFSGRITKVDRRRQRLQITFEFDGLERKVWTGYDISAKKL